MVRKIANRDHDSIDETKQVAIVVGNKSVLLPALLLQYILGFGGSHDCPDAVSGEFMREYDRNVKSLI
jgi:hypothetical protein